MTDTELLFALVDDKIRAAREDYIITNTNFLDIYEQSRVMEHLKGRGNINFELFGGFPDAERQVAVFLPDYAKDLSYFDENPGLLPIRAIKIKKDNFSSLTHRDYLGALMGLGIKREMIGDILVNDGGCHIAVMESVAKYIAGNLTSAGRGSVKAEICRDFSEFRKNDSFEEKRCYVSSMRIDGVAAAVFDISRNAAAEKIRRGEVFLNGYEVSKTDLKVNFGSKLTLRGFGKAVIDEDAGITRKGRQAFIVKKYI